MEADESLPAEARGAAPGRSRLTGRRVLVIGGGSQPNDDPDSPIGNGRAVCALAAREGAAVAVVDIDAQAAAETVSLVEAEGVAGHALVADVADPDACADVVGRAVGLLGGLDGVVCNVGVGGGRWLAGTTAEAWDRVLAVNVRSHFLVAQAALEHVGAGSSIVFVSSVAGLQPGSTIPAYDTSKAALLGLSRHVAFEGARKGVRANVVAPGLIDTPLGRAATRGRPSRGRTPVPLGRQGTGWEVAYLVLFLLSDESSYVTGQTLVVDGGLSALT